MIAAIDTPMIEVENLAKSFVLHNQGGVLLPVLDAVSLQVRAGECVVLQGPSGAGKSTLLKCIYATYRSSAGHVRIRQGAAQVDVTKANSRELLALRRDTVGYVSQFLRVIPRVPAIDIVSEPLAELAGEDETALARARAAAEHLLLRLRIPRRLWELPPATFSGGEQQRINIARSLIRRKPVLLLDEPTASLDAENRITVTHLINEARQAGCAVLGIVHDARVRDAIATRVIDMGRLQ